MLTDFFCSVINNGGRFIIRSALYNYPFRSFFCSPCFSQPDFGMLFDIDGVIARGHNPIPECREAMKMLCDEHGHPKIPVAFVTNGCNRACDKAKQLSQWCGFEVRANNVLRN